MMDVMEEFKEFFSMYEPVRPVKIRIMNKEHQRKGQEKIKPAVLVNISIESDIRLNPGFFDDYQSDCREDKDSERRIADFAKIIRLLRKILLEPSGKESAF